MKAVAQLKRMGVFDPGFYAVPLGGGASCTAKDLLETGLAARHGLPLHGVSHEALELLARRSDIVDVPRGGILQQQYERATNLFFQIEGQYAIIHLRRGDPDDPQAQVVWVDRRGGCIGDAEVILRNVELDPVLHGAGTNEYRATAVCTRAGRAIRCFEPGFILEEPCAHRLAVNLGQRVALTLFARETRVEISRLQARLAELTRMLRELRDPHDYPHAPRWSCFEPRLTIGQVANLLNVPKESARLALGVLSGWNEVRNVDFIADESRPLGWDRRYGILFRPEVEPTPEATG